MVDLNTNLTANYNNGELYIAQDDIKLFEFSGTNIKFLGNASSDSEGGVSRADYWGSTITLSESVKEFLGVMADSMSYWDLVLAYAEEMYQELDSDDLGIDLGEIGAEDIEMLCILLCQKSKSELVKTLKATLESKVDQRNRLNDDYTKKQMEVVEQQQKAEKEAKKAKVRGIFKSIFGAVAAVVGLAVSIVLAAGTLGAASAGSVAMIAACVGIGLSVVSTACTLTTSGLSIATLCGKGNDKMNMANMIIGGIGAVAGLAAAICSGIGAYNAAKNVVEGAKSLSTTVKTVCNTVNGLTQIAEGSLGVADGAENIKAAKVQRDLETIKIQLFELDEDIKILSQFMDSLSEDVQEFIKNMLECEQLAASELKNMVDSMLSLCQA